MYLIDTHCHLNFKAFAKDLPDIVRRAKEAGVEKIIVPGTDLASSRKAVKIAQTYDGCFAAVGIHPHHAQDPKLIVNDELRHQLEELIVGEGKIVAVGEIGLDYYRYTKTKYSDSKITFDMKQKQKELLIMQLDLAVIHNLPVILHCRDAWADLIQIISSESSQISRKHSPANKYIKRHHPPAGGLRGVFHCFTGSTSQLQLIITMGYYVGFDGNITYDETQYSPLVAATPLNHILLETDSPYLAPIPYRGKRNEPKNLTLVAQAVAKYKSTTLPSIIQQTTENAEELCNSHTSGEPVPVTPEELKALQFNS